MGDNFSVKIKNYQRVEDADLTFVPGLNVIVGKTNSGKSAIIRAIETAIYNLARESHITLGKDKSAVQINYKGHDIVWRRDKSSASQVSYRVDGKVYTKVGRGQPEMVSEALGITETEVNGKKFRVNFAKQMAYPFLLDSTPSEFFKFIVQSGEDDKVTDVLDTMKKDYQEIKSNIKTFEATRDTIAKSYQREKQEYESLKDQSSYADKVLDLDPKVEAYRRLQEQIETMSKAQESIYQLTVSLDREKALFTTLGQNLAVVTIAMNKYKELAGQVQNYSSSREVAENMRSQVSGLLVLMEKTKDIQVYRRRLYNLESKIASKTALSSYIENRNHYFNIVEVDSTRLKKMRDTISDADIVLGKVKDKLKSVDDMKSKYKDIREKSLEHFRQSTQVSELQKRVKANEDIIQDIEKELAGFGVCPHCGAPIENGKYHVEEV